MSVHREELVEEVERAAKIVVTQWLATNHAEATAERDLITAILRLKEFDSGKQRTCVDCGRALTIEGNVIFCPNCNLATVGADRSRFEQE